MNAGDVDILAAELKQAGDGSWAADVTLAHGDTGWDHYADRWRVVDGEGNILGERVLYHPHVEEQPFTRSLRGVRIPADTGVVHIEAHDKVHGWSPNRLAVDPGQARDGRVRVESQ